MSSAATLDLPAGSRRLADILPHGRLAGPMPWVIAIMMFLSVLAAAAALSFAGASLALGSAMSGQISVRIVDANASTRAAAARRVADWLRAQPGVSAVTPVPEADVIDQLRPWLGDDMATLDIPVPALIDAALETTDDAARAEQIASIQRNLAAVAANATVEAHAGYLTPLRRMVATIGWLSAGIVALMVGATSAVVFLAARAAHATHRGTIDILHMMGATDQQVARLFQRRIALDAGFGALLGAGLGVAAILLLGRAVASLASGLLQSVALPNWGWTFIVALPILGVLVALITARLTVLRVLKETL